MNDGTKASSGQQVSFGLMELHADTLADFSELLARHQLWFVLPDAESDLSKAVGVFDTYSGRVFRLDMWLAFLGENPFLYVCNKNNAKRIAVFKSVEKMLWSNETSKNPMNLDDAKQAISAARLAGLDGWRIPTKSELQDFAKAKTNPCRKGSNDRLSTASGNQAHNWLTAGGCQDLDNWTSCSGSGYLFACHPIWHDFSDLDILANIIARGWSLVSPQGAEFPDRPLADNGQQLPVEALIEIWVQQKLHLCAYGERDVFLTPRNYWILAVLEDVDYKPCRLPRLDAAQMSDPGKGMWELFGEPPELLKKLGLVARDPAQDVRHRAVAIDFGTSSTVVAMDTPSGSRELLRIGVRDFYEKVQPQHFENPTVLECLNFSEFETEWRATAYRPALDWDWMRAAHEAQASFRDNPGDPRILASILLRLKQWALRSERTRVRLTDRQGREIELPAHVERNPVRGQPLAVGSDTVFDPVEVYAWYLSMSINWRGRGLFLKYYLSFPVKYPREVKNRVLASFRRGLQRGLPASLVGIYPHVLNDFEVTELASEPAAYAAAALPSLGVEPSEVGVPYAVFDFGGGTTDFDFGLLRWASAEEESKGYERVQEHLASGGDNFLGGENLLEHLVYDSFLNNLQVLRDKRIQFTKPLDAKAFPGSEASLSQTQAAQTNTVMLAAKLRPFLEDTKEDTKEDVGAAAGRLSPQIKLDLIDADGNKQSCELSLNAEALDELLHARIKAGVEAFLEQLSRLRGEFPPGVAVHVLLAGNGSLSRHIKVLFDPTGKHWPLLLAKAFGDSPPEIVVHSPLPVDEVDPHAPTGKTGVALGLLRLAPGENTLMIDHVHARNEGQAPFAWFVGRMRRGRFDPVMLPDVHYGEWFELGRLQQGVFNLFVTSSPRAHQGLPEGDPELSKHRLDFPAAPADARLFARASAPGILELVALMDPNLLHESPVEKLVLG